MEIKQLLLLYTNEVSNREIAKRLSIGRNTVNRYINHFKAMKLDKDQLRALSEEDIFKLFKREKKKCLRKELLHACFPQVKKDKSKDGFTFQKIWEEYKQEYEDGYGYSQFMEYYHEWNKSNDATLKLHHKVGEKLMVDYAGKRLSIVDKQTGEVISVEVFVACLPASGYIYVEASKSQQKTDFINSMSNCLDYIGGVPQMIVTDNLKSAVTKSSKYEAIANRTLKDLGLYYGAILNPTRPYSPKDKALVERSVRLVYEQIYFTMRNEVYHTLHELNNRIWQLLEVLNDRKLSQLNCSRAELFLEIEKNVLKPLPSQPYQIRGFKRAKVQKTSHVLLSEDKHYYSVPYRYIGKRVQIQYTHRLVEIYANHHRIATHFRNGTAAGYTTKKDHLPSTHQFYLSWNPKLFIDNARKIGPYTQQYIERLFKQNGHAETKYKTAMGIVQLIKKYETQRIEGACKVGMLHPTSSYQRIVSILDKELDLSKDLFDLDEEDNHIPDHENIRGQLYYSQQLNNTIHESND